MRGDYILTLADGKQISMRFCVWSLQRFCEKNNVSFSQMNDVIIEGMTLHTLIELTHAAVEYPFYKAGLDCPYSSLDIADWIDDLGGIDAPGVVAIPPLIIESISSKKKQFPTIPEEQRQAGIKMILEKTEQLHGTI